MYAEFFILHRLLSLRNKLTLLEYYINFTKAFLKL